MDWQRQHNPSGRPKHMEVRLGLGQWTVWLCLARYLLSCFEFLLWGEKHPPEYFFKKFEECSMEAVRDIMIGGRESCLLSLYCFCSRFLKWPECAYVLPKHSHAHQQLARDKSTNLH